ncbi:MAG: ABC transporter permease [Clostridia bacterium]|nr:ABC transporter permease [Clostridia bacterium]
MRKYIIKRLLQSVVILFFVAFIIYALMRCLPTSFVEAMARQKSMQPGSKSYEEWLQQLNAMYNLDKGIFVGFFNWLNSMIHGQFGDSWRWTIPVVEKFNDCVWISFIMGAISFFFELIIAIPLGIIAATKQYSKSDYIISIVALAGISLPTFFFASLMKLVFSVKLGWFELGGLVSRNYDQLNAIGQFFDKAQHLVLPIITLVVISMGSLMRYTRTNMLEVLNADYIRTARAKGLSERKVIYRHAFRNTLIPIVTIVGGSLPGLFAGALITETLYSIPGIGFVAYQSEISGDIPFTMFYLVFLAVLTLLGNLLSDVLYAVVDPRVRVS